MFPSHHTLQNGGKPRSNFAATLAQVQLDHLHFGLDTAKKVVWKDNDGEEEAELAYFEQITFSHVDVEEGEQFQQMHRQIQRLLQGAEDVNIWLDCDWADVRQLCRVTRLFYSLAPLLADRVDSLRAKANCRFLPHAKPGNNRHLPRSLFTNLRVFCLNDRYMDKLEAGFLTEWLTDKEYAARNPNRPRMLIFHIDNLNYGTEKYLPRLPNMLKTHFKFSRRPVSYFVRLNCFSPSPHTTMSFLSQKIAPYQLHNDQTSEQFVVEKWSESGSRDRCTIRVSRHPSSPGTGERDSWLEARRKELMDWHWAGQKRRVLIRSHEEAKEEEEANAIDW